MEAPKPHQSSKTKISAIILGCDPTAFDKSNNLLQFNTVFDIGGDKRYFAGILKNLNELNLTMEDIYVQNLIPEYREVESSKDKNWIKAAQGFISARKTEFDKLDPSRTVPVFLTSELIYKALLNDNEKPRSAKDIYNTLGEFFIPASMNKLGRPLVPFYRHLAYSMKNKQEIASKIREVFNF
jgi:hypothetical protein